MPDFPADYGENTYWVRQTGSVSLDGALTETKEVMFLLGKKYYELTGHKLVITSVTDGSSHGTGGHSHYNGWKFDCNDFGDGVAYGGYFGESLDSDIANQWVEYGHSLGVAPVNEEKAYGTGHFDVCIDGEDWYTSQSYGGYPPNGKKPDPGSAAKTPAKTSGTSNVSTKNDSSGSAGNGTSKDVVNEGNRIYIRPYGKTFAEPMYPDLQYVAGNIPNSLVEKIVQDNNDSIDDLNVTAAPYKIISGSAMQDLTGLDIGGFTTDKAQEERQKVFNAYDSINEFKPPSGGKPLNNHDRYPVDLKAEELTIHQPQVKQNEITLRNVDDDKVTLAAAILTGLDHAEKRIVKLENVLATVMRYVFGMGGRMYVNCQYYGGQDHRAKYKCIRCLKDDHVNDGKIVQIDQCLSCSRYEPVVGATMEILNELGTNLSAILDDCQSGYMNMRDYLKFTRTDWHPSPRETVRFKPETSGVRSPLEKDFDEVWDEGIKQKWRLTPIENQKPSVNWRQDINHPDITMKKLPSFQYNPGNAGSVGNSTAAQSCAVTAGSMKEIMAKHYSAMKNSTDAAVLRWYQKAEDWATGTGGGCRTTIVNLNDGGYANVLKECCNKSNVDPLLMLSIFCVETEGNINATNGGIGQVEANIGKEASLTPEQHIQAAIDCWKGKIISADGDNPMGPTQAYNSTTATIDKLRSPDRYYDKDWVTALTNDFHDQPWRMEYWPRVVCSYAKFASMPEQLSVLSNGSSQVDWQFPFKDEDLKDVKFKSDYKATNEGSGAASLNQGIIFETKKGLDILLATDAELVGSGEDEKYGKWLRYKCADGDEVMYCGVDGIGDAVIEANDEAEKKENVEKTSEKARKNKGSQSSDTENNQTTESQNGTQSSDNGEGGN